MGDTQSKIFIASNQAKINIINDPAILWDAVAETTWHPTSTGLIKCHARGHVCIGGAGSRGMLQIPVYYSPYIANNILTLQTLVHAQVVNGSTSAGDDSKYTIRQVAADPTLEIFEAQLSQIAVMENPQTHLGRNDLVCVDADTCVAPTSDHHRKHIGHLTVEDQRLTFCVEDTVIGEAVEGQTNPLLMHKSCVYQTTTTTPSSWFKLPGFLTRRRS